jgi:hypothetical protein
LLVSVTVTVCGVAVTAGEKLRVKVPRHWASILVAVAVDAGTMTAVRARRKAAARVTGRRERRRDLPDLGRVDGLVLGMFMALLLLPWLASSCASSRAVHLLEAAVVDPCMVGPLQGISL